MISQYKYSEDVFRLVEDKQLEQTSSRIFNLKQHIGTHSPIGPAYHENFINFMLNIGRILYDTRWDIYLACGSESLGEVVDIVVHYHFNNSNGKSASHPLQQTIKNLILKLKKFRIHFDNNTLLSFEEASYFAELSNKLRAQQLSNLICQKIDKIFLDKTLEIQKIRISVHKILEELATRQKNYLNKNDDAFNDFIRCCRSDILYHSQDELTKHFNAINSILIEQMNYYDNAALCKDVFDVTEQINMKYVEASKIIKSAISEINKLI